MILVKYIGSAGWSLRLYFYLEVAAPPFIQMSRIVGLVDPLH